MQSTLGEKIFYYCNYSILALVGLSCLLPLIHIISLSLSSSRAIISGWVTLWPVELSFDPYLALIKGGRIITSFENSVIIAVVGVAFNMLFTILAAYPLSRANFSGRRFYILAIVFTMLFGGGLIPTYLVIKSLGLVNTYWALWLPGLVSPFNMLIMKTYFENIPVEMEEAARIDGCGEWRLILQIFLPLSMPVIAALSLFYGVHHWNAFFHVLIYINDPDKYNLSVLVQQMIAQTNLLSEIENFQPEDQQSLTPEAVKAAAIVVMIVPMLIVYPFLQKHFVKGVMLGAIKG